MEKSRGELNMRLKKLGDIDIEKVVKAAIPFEDDIKVIYSKFYKKGHAGWPIWFIVIDLGWKFNAYNLITICGYGDHTKLYRLADDFDVFSFDTQLKAQKNLFEFRENASFFQSEKVFTVNESYRLYKALKAEGVVMFEATNY